MAELKQIIDTLDEASDGFARIADKQQKKMYEDVLLLCKRLETSVDGKLKQSITNLKLLTQIKAKLAKLAKDDEWVAGIGKFLQYFSVVQKQQMQYFSSNFAENTLTNRAKDKHELMKQMAVQNTIDGLVGTGLQANVTDKINDILLRAVTSGEKFADLVKELRDHLLGAEGGSGAFSRYAKTYATTAMTQFTGQNNKLLTDDLGLEWFMYVGSNKETTREFCEHLTKKRYIHKSEIPTILQGRIDDYQCAIYPKTGLPYGMIEGTNEDNFQCNCGGWNCRHQLVPVDEAAVPASVRAKFVNNDKVEKFTPTDEQKQKVFIIEKYIQEHPKSAKIAKYYESLKDSLFNNDEDKFESLLSSAISDIKKFNAAKNAVEKKKSKEQNKTGDSNSLTPIVPLKKEYKTKEDAADTIKQIDSKLTWFNPDEGGAKEIRIDPNPNNNGSTNYTGMIWLSKTKLNRLCAAMTKIAEGKSEDISKVEAMAISTYWHEVTHNRNHTGTRVRDKMTDTERKYMECANEFVARATLEEFYEAFGCKIPKNAKPLQMKRTDTSYENMIAPLNVAISLLKCNRGTFNSLLKNSLFNGSYKKLENGIVNALYESGAKNMVYDKNSAEESITIADCKEITMWAVVDEPYPDYMKVKIEKNYPNLRSKKQ